MVFLTERGRASFGAFLTGRLTARLTGRLMVALGFATGVGTGALAAGGGAVVGVGGGAGGTAGVSSTRYAASIFSLPPPNGVKDARKAPLRPIRGHPE